MCFVEAGTFMMGATSEQEHEAYSDEKATKSGYTELLLGRNHCYPEIMECDYGKLSIGIQRGESSYREYIMD